MQNFRHLVYQLEVVFGIVQAIINRLWPENQCLGNSAGADNSFGELLSDELVRKEKYVQEINSVMMLCAMVFSVSIEAPHCAADPDWQKVRGKFLHGGYCASGTRI